MPTKICMALQMTSLHVLAIPEFSTYYRLHSNESQWLNTYFSKMQEKWSRFHRNLTLFWRGKSIYIYLSNNHVSMVTLGKYSFVMCKHFFSLLMSSSIISYCVHGNNTKLFNTNLNISCKYWNYSKHFIFMFIERTVRKSRITFFFNPKNLETSFFKNLPSE